MILLYPTLCRMSSPSNRRAAPRPAGLRAALAGMLGGAPEGRRRGNTVTRSVCAVAAAGTSPRGCLENSIFMRRGVTRDMTVLSQFAFFHFSI